MKRITVTIRIPLFAEVDVELEDRDYDTMIEEWDRANFGIVKSVISEYVDLNDLDLVGAGERYGDAEIVDLKPEEQEKIIVEVEDQDEFEYTTIIPKGKPN